jgi:hypothetical protein
MSYAADAINLAIVVAVAMIFIFIGGAGLYTHNHQPTEKKNPTYFAVGIAFAGVGGSILAQLVLGLLVPADIRSLIREHKAPGRI